jgi:hypothetical protein
VAVTETTAAAALKAAAERLLDAEHVAGEVRRLDPDRRGVTVSRSAGK